MKIRKKILLLLQVILDMPFKPFKKSKKELVPGTIVKCQSGRFIAYYEHRTDIIANGENEKDAKNNLKKMYDIVIKMESEEDDEKNNIKLPTNHLANTVLGELPQVVSVENKESHQAVEGATQVVRQNEQRKKYCTYNGNCGFRGVKTIRCFYNAYCEFQSAIWASSPAQDK